MGPDWYVRLSAASGPAWIGAWSNADVVAVVLVVFTLSFIVGASLAANWPFDVAFISLVVGGVLVTWPAMVTLCLVAIPISIVLSYLHRWLAPRRAAAISAEADRIAEKAVADFKRDAGVPR